MTFAIIEIEPHSPLYGPVFHFEGSSLQIALGPSQNEISPLRRVLF